MVSQKPTISIWPALGGDRGALAQGEVLARCLTMRAPREGEAGATGKLTVQVHSPDSRLQPSRLVVPGPPGGESLE